MGRLALWRGNSALFFLSIITLSQPKLKLAHNMRKEKIKPKLRNISALVLVYFSNNAFKGKNRDLVYLPLNEGLFHKSV